MIRQLLIAAFGCRNTVALILNFGQEDITFQDVAALIGIDRSQASRLVRQAYRNAQSLVQTAKAALRQLALDDSGATISVQHGVALNGIDRWAASYNGFEQRHRILSFETVCAFLHRNKNCFIRRPNTHLGIWFDPDDQRFCLDITRLFVDRSRAIQFAKRQKQQAIFNLKTRETIVLNRRRRLQVA